MLDQLIGSGDVVWWGVGALTGGDGVVCLAPADRAAELRPAESRDDLDPTALAVLDALDAGGALFFRDIADRVGAGASGSPVAGDLALVDALWLLVWAGLVTNDGWAALRARIDGGTARPAVRRGRPRLPSRSGPPASSGRWSVLPDPQVDPVRRATAVGQALLDRHGIVTRGTVVSERVAGGFAAVYRVLSAFEDAGRCRRTYAIEGLGAAQFALPTAVDRLRSLQRSATGHRAGGPQVVALAATDPAQAYGAALSWPPLPGTEATHRPGRKAGAVVVLVDGDPAAYIERGGKSLLVWDRPEEVMAAALAALAQRGATVGMGRSVIARINGAPPTPELTSMLGDAGFLPTPRGFRSPRG
jgi:ATP-dependent Lhr-like helicase